LKEPPFFLYDGFVNKLIIFLLTVFLFGCSSTNGYQVKDEDGNWVTLTWDEGPTWEAERHCKKNYPANPLEECMEYYIPQFTKQLAEWRQEERDRQLAEENKNEDSDDETNEWTCIYLKAKYEGFKQTQKNYERQARSLRNYQRISEANNALSKAKQKERDANRWKRRHNDKCSPKIW
tara:strand:- start:79 stop:612 length:534 start_codon:yes stop_codon:yes gene_type:complete